MARPGYSFLKGAKGQPTSGAVYDPISEQQLLLFVAFGVCWSAWIEGYLINPALGTAFS